MELLDVNKTAEILKISRKKLYRMISANQLPSLLVGSSIRIPKEKLDEWICSEMIAVKGEDEIIGAA
jgi:excisionase family DNA binding protein